MNYLGTRTWLSVTATYALLVTAASSRADATTLIDFETCPDANHSPTQDGDILGARYGSEGVLFDYTGPYPASAYISDSYPGDPPGHGVASPIDEFYRTAFNITFTSPQTTVQFNGAADCAHAIATAEAFDSTGFPVAIESLSIPLRSDVTVFSLHTLSPQISSINFEASGDASCNTFIDNLQFDQAPAPPPSPPTVTITAPLGNGDFVNTDQPVTAVGAISGVDLFPYATLVFTTLDSSSGQATASTSYFAVPALSGTQIPFSVPVRTAPLPVGSYLITITVSDRAGQTAQATTQFSNFPSALTDLRLNSPLGDFEFAVPDQGPGGACQMLYFVGGSIAYSPQSDGRINVPQAVAAKWLSTSSPMLGVIPSLGCPTAVADTSVAGWTIQDFDRGRIYVPPSGPSLYTTSIFVSAMAWVAQAQGRAKEFEQLGAPVADPLFNLDVNDPTWMFQRFDQNQRGPTYMNTLEVRGRVTPNVLIERIGGDPAQVLQAGAAIDDNTPTLWESYPCSFPTVNGIWPVQCTFPSTFPTTQAVPVDAADECQRHAVDATDIALDEVIEWVPIGTRELSGADDFIPYKSYQGLIKLNDFNTQNEPGSHLAYEDLFSVHQNCGSWEDGNGAFGAFTLLVGGILECADLVGDAAEAVQGNNSCWGSGTALDELSGGKWCRSDWNLHTRPLPGAENWSLLSSTNYEEPVGVKTEDFEIEFESAWAAKFYAQFTPQTGDALQIHGRWIADCGHDDWHAEIHPADAVAVTRSIVAHGGQVGALRISLGYLWVNRFLANGSRPPLFVGGPPVVGTVTQSVFAPPRPSPTAQMVVFHNEHGYTFARNVSQGDPKEIGGGFSVTTVDTTLTKPTIEDSGEMIYPDPGNAPEFQDFWVLYWQDLGQTILVGGLPF